MGAVSGKKILMVIASDKFRDEEYQKPRRILEQEGASVTVASSTLKESTGMLGLKVKPDILLQNADMSAYDAVIFVGGYGAQEYWDDPAAHALARKAFNSGKLTSAICVAPMTLANAGILKGRKATIWPDCADDFKTKGVVYTGSPVEKDGTLITGSGPDAADAFGKALLQALKQRPS
ncbi:MAG: DJ-1/PfpI family protein [Candidatus Omnitrophica bacterium]|nr:DJ-1/PfpI family protein [Candidatus Omnitrophota bacterium]